MLGTVVMVGTAVSFISTFVLVFAKLVGQLHRSWLVAFSPSLLWLGFLYVLIFVVLMYIMITEKGDKNG
jgi:hypothetical protein